MKTILVPTDFSKCSMYALEFAAYTALKSKAELHILNVVHPPSYYFTGIDPLVGPPVGFDLQETFYENLRNRAKANLCRLAARRFLKGIKTRTFLGSDGSIHEKINEHAKKFKADMIIMGTYGSSGFKGILVGSNAERVVRFAGRPVLVINEKVKNPKLRTVVFASDFSKESYAVFPLVRSFADLFGAEIHLLKVNTRDKFERTSDNEDLMNKFNKRFGGKYVSAIYDDFMVEEGILNYAEKVKADIIALGSHGKKGLARFFPGVVSEGVVRLSQRPILTVNLYKGN